MTLIEILIGLALMAVVLLMVGYGYRAVVKGNVEVNNTAEMQSIVKAAGHQLEGDLKRAGFGMGGGAAFSTMKGSEIALNFLDLPGATCAQGEPVSIHYSISHNAIVRELACNGKPKPSKATEGGRDTLDMRFRYLDNTGNTAATSDKVRTVEYTIEVRAGMGTKKSRASTGSVSIVNNG